MQPAAFHWHFLAPVFIALGCMGIAVVAIVTEHRRKQTLLEERRLMIEKGLVPPPLDRAMLGDEPRAGSQGDIESSLRQGIMLVFVGLGLFAAFLLLHYVLAENATPIPAKIAALMGPAGVLVALIGVGHLVYCRVLRGRSTGSGV